MSKTASNFMAQRLGTSKSKPENVVTASIQNLKNLQVDDYKAYTNANLVGNPKLRFQEKTGNLSPAILSSSNAGTTTAHMARQTSDVYSEDESSGGCEDD